MLFPQSWHSASQVPSPSPKFNLGLGLGLGTPLILKALPWILYLQRLNLDKSFPIHNIITRWTVYPMLRISWKAALYRIVMNIHYFFSTFQETWSAVDGNLPARPDIRSRFCVAFYKSSTYPIFIFSGRIQAVEWSFLPYVVWWPVWLCLIPGQDIPCENDYRGWHRRKQPNRDSPDSTVWRK